MNFRETPHTGPPAAGSSGNLLGTRCVVTLDPLSCPSQPVAGIANIDSGFIARIGPDWVVLRDGCNEN